MGRKLIESKNFCVGGEVLTCNLYEIKFNQGYIEEELSYLIKVINLSNKKIAECAFGINPQKECLLDYIEINNSNYANKAIGTKLIKMVEEIAKKNNCKEIIGIYAPYGSLAENSAKFYKKNKFDIVNVKGKYVQSQEIYKKINYEKCDK